MNVKIDTKEKFSVLTPEAAIISANMTEDIARLGEYALAGVPHLIINLYNVTEIYPEPARKLAEMQQQSYEHDHSFVICEMKPDVQKVFDDEDLTEIMNITPTESEAWDIVQMEEIERELMSGFDADENSG